MNNVEANENTNLDEMNNDIATEVQDEFKDAIAETLSNLRMKSMLLGAQNACTIILDKILMFEKTPGSKSNNDHKRLIKDIKHFCETGLFQNVDSNDEAETIQN